MFRSTAAFLVAIVLLQSSVLAQTTDLAASTTQSIQLCVSHISLSDTGYLTLPNTRSVRHYPLQLDQAKSFLQTPLVTMPRRHLILLNRRES
jgi:hypothetical protein